jgi:hypothetical protein
VTEPAFRICQRVLHEKKYAITKEWSPVVRLSSLTVRRSKKARLSRFLKAANKGVVLLDHDSSKEGKVKSTIKSIIVQPGESHQILDGAELRIEDGAKVKKG